MANKEHNHTIDHQIINLEIEGIEDDNEINETQQNFIYFYKEHIGKELDKTFSKLVPADVDIHIDELTLDLGELNFEKPADLEKAIIKRMKKVIEKELLKKIKVMEEKTPGQKRRKQKFSKMSILEFFLQNGFYPNWASTSNGSISEIFDDLSRQNAKVLVQRIFLLRKHKKVRERLYQQFSSRQLTLLFELLYGKKSILAKKQIQFLQKKLGQQSEKAILSAAINYVLDGSSALGTIAYNERTFARKILEEVQQRTTSSNIKTKVRAGYEGQYQDIQIIEYFLEYGAIPNWADVSSKQSLQELFKQLLDRQLVSIQRMVERHTETPNFIQRLIFQFSTEHILQLLEPTPNENIKFIQASIHDFDFLTTSRQNINQGLSSHQIRQIVLAEVLDYFFVQKKNKFVKKTFIKLVLEKLAYATETDYDALVKESYKSVRRKKGGNTAIRSTLEQLDEHLQQKLSEERKELRQAKKMQRKIDKALQKLIQKQQKGNISAVELGELRSLSKQIKALDQTIEGLEDLDMPLEIELLIQQRHELKQQLKIANQQELDKLEKRLSNTEREFKKLQSTLHKEVENLLKDKERLHSKVGSIAQQRVKRVNNRINKYHRAIKNVIQQLSLDQKDIKLFLTDINKALRGAISSEEKQRLRQERSRLQKELIQINEYIEQLKKQELALEDALKTTLVVIEQPAAQENIVPTGTSKLDALIFMLQYGATPWWAEDLPRQTIEELFLEFTQQSPEKLRRALLQVGKYPVVWERTINQLSENAIQTVLQQLYSNDAKIIFKQAELLSTIHFSQGFATLNNVERKKFKWGVIVEYLLSRKQRFNAQDFTKEITLQTARLYNISPTKLVEYTGNIIQNKGVDYVPFAAWNEALVNDKSINALERELILQAQEQQQKAEGIYLNDQQKLELLTDFLSSGRINTKAKELKYTTVEQFETLLLEQIQENRPQTQQLVFNLLRLSNVRNLIITNLSEDIFWEVVYLIRPKALLPVRRHFEDFKKVSDHKKLELEKDVLFNFFLGQQQDSFDVNNYVKAIFIAKQKATGRKILALLTETKRRLKALGTTALQSSWLISILMLEVETLKQEEKTIQDMELRANLNEQVEFVAKEYTETASKMVDVLSEETAESHGLPQKEYKLEELEKIIQSHQEELSILQENLAQGDALQLLEDKRKIALYVAQLKLLKQQRPPLLRKLEKQLDELSTNLTQLEEKIQEEEVKHKAIEPLADELDFLPSLLECKVNMLEQIKKELPSALKTLPSLLEDLEDKEQNHALFIQDLEQVVLELKDEQYQQSILDILSKSTLTAVSIEKLQQSINIDARQQQVLEKMDQIAPFLLWKEWEALESYYAQHPQELTPKKATIQEQIRLLIQQKEHKNFLGYGQILDTAQKRLEQVLNKATTLEELADVQEEIEHVWQQQQLQVDELVEVVKVKDPSIQKDFKQLRKNIDAIFTQLQNERIKRTNAILTEEYTRLKEEKTEKTLQVKELEQQKDFVLDQIQKAENPPKTSPQEMAKKKREPKTPVPAPIEEPLQIFNAGMVLLWPYLGRLFSMLGYVKNKEFVDIDAQYKAIHLLQYLVTGKTEAPENELLLNKIFCNFPITEPVPFGIEFSPDELKVAESLLGGVIQNWPKMKSMTPNSLRGSFLIRQGTVKEEEGKWFVKVEKQTFDILLKTLPWSFTFIRFPWAEKFISVEWKLM